MQPLSTQPGLSPQEGSLVGLAQGTSGSLASAQAPATATPAPGNASQGSQPTGQLDPDAVNLSKAIRQTESGGDATARGKSGEYGAYQWEPKTWATMSSAAGVNVPLEQSTLQQQNQVAYNQIKKWKDQGYNVGQIASMWNSGNPDAYQTGESGTNASGAHYDVSAYAKSVATAYQSIKNGGQVGTDPSNPSSVQGGTVSGYGGTQTPSDGSNVTGYGGQPIGQIQAPQGTSVPAPTNSSLTGVPVLDSIANFLFPVAGDIKNDIEGTQTKSKLQQVGDLGLSVLPLVPGLGEIGEALRGGAAATEGGVDAAGAASGLISKLFANKAVQGSALGYGAGALGNLSQGQSLGQAISPNLGTLGGAATGGIANTLLPKILAPFTKNLTKGGAQAGLEDALTTEANRLKPTIKVMAKMPNAGADALKVIARTPDALPTVVDGHHFDTTEASKVITQRINALSQLRASALDKTGAKFSLTGDLQANAVKLFNDNPNSPTRLQDAEAMMHQVSEYARNYGGDEITASQLEAIKEANPYASPVARAARNLLEKQSETEGLPDLKAFNKVIQSHIHANTILQKMQGQVVKGGRLGNMLRGHTAGAIGGLAGTAAGGGFLGTIGGALAGEGASKLLGHWAANTSLTTPLQEALLEKLQMEDPEIIQQYAKSVGKETPTVPQRVPQAPPTASTLRNLLVSKASQVPSMLTPQ